MKTIIFDLDGTLADCSHRLPLIYNEPKQWDKFHAECINDKPIDSVFCILDEMTQNYDIVFLTTRPDTSKDLTIDWLWKQSYLITEEQLLMRKSGDRRPDDIVKLEILEREGLTPDKVLFIVEDRNRVVKAMREKGYKVLQPQNGDY